MSNKRTLLGLTLAIAIVTLLTVSIVTYMAYQQAQPKTTMNGVKAMEIKHFGQGQRAMGNRDDSIKDLRWTIRNGKKVLQQQRYGIPPNFKFPEGQSVVHYFYYWEDVPMYEESSVLSP